MKPILRMATERDAAAICDIYAPFCDGSVTSFEASAPSLEEMQSRIRKITAQFPWLVCEREGEVLGYAYAGAHRERAAYRWAVDVAVYIGERHHRMGIGRALYTALFRLLVAQGYFKACAGITLPNAASVGLHEAMGFKLVGVYPGVGFKLGAWRDVGWWQLALQPERANPPEPRYVREVESSADWQNALAAGAKLLQP
ncbi:MAG: N-acetyltransferase family protein [Pedosphaera sp.]|nr:N-acetyltransferase family protein [Pedosphaera sp.]